MQCKTHPDFLPCEIGCIDKADFDIVEQVSLKLETKYSSAVKS
jgi:hypothetical protein